MPLADSLRRRARALLTTTINEGWAWVKHHGAVTAGHPLAAHYGSVGTGSRIAFPWGDHLNLQAVRIGEQCFVGEDVTFAVGFPTEVFPDPCDPVVELGDRTVVGKGCWFVARERLVLEHDVTVAPNVYFTDTNHTYADPWLPVGTQMLQCEHVRVGAGTWIGTNVVVLPGSDIGRNCAIAAGTVVRGTVPDHSVVAGVPGRVLRRWTEQDGWQPPIPDPVVPLEGWPVGVPPAAGTGTVPGPRVGDVVADLGPAGGPSSGSA